MRHMPQSRNVTHRTQEEGQTGPENSVYPNILSSFLCFVMGALGLRTRSWARNKTPEDGLKKGSRNESSFPAQSIFFATKFAFIQSRILKIEPKMMLCFGFSYLAVFMSNHSSQSEREMKQRMTERHFL